MSQLEAGLTDLMSMKGAICAAVVDSDSGMIIGSQGSGIDIEIAAAGSTEIVRAERLAMKALRISGALEDILITLDTQHHIIRPAQHAPGLFIYFVLDREGGNLALARRKVQDVDRELVI